MHNVRLGELESAVMDHIWECDGFVTVPEVYRSVGKKRRLAYTTVMTVMSRLHDKDLLHRDEDRRPYSYWPAMSREDFSAGLMLGILANLDERGAVLARFVERIGPRDAELLRKLVRKGQGKTR